MLEQTNEVLGMFECDGFFFDIIAQGQCLCRWCLSGMAEAGLDPDFAVLDEDFSAWIARTGYVTG